MNRIKKFARENRKQPTKEEQTVWRWLRDRRFQLFKFRRQHPIDRYIADFYCHELKLVIELDGQGHHATFAAEMRDVGRDCDLSKLGVTVVRIANEEIRLRPVYAGQKILQAIEALTRSRCAGPPSPARGRGRS